MTTRIEVASPLPATEVLSRLAIYGHEWRESKIPQALRTRYYTCRIDVRSDEFELELQPQGNGPIFIWLGGVTADASGGSRIRARARQKRWSLIFTLIFLTAFFGWWFYPQVFGEQRSADSAVFAIGGACLFLLFQAAVTAGRAMEQGDACKVIFAHILGDNPYRATLP